MENRIEEVNSSENESFAPEYRDRLRTWLVKMIESDTIPGLHWENEEKTVFRMPWKHAGRQDYNLEEDSKIFMAWAIHSGRYREGTDKPEPIVWKTRLRCALNKMPDIRELPDRSRLDISEPYRVYQLLPPVHKASQIRRRLYKRSQSHDADHTRSAVNTSQQAAVVNTSKECENERAKQINSQRRNASVDATGYNTTVNGRLDNSFSVPNFWLNPSAMSVNSSISPVLPSIHTPTASSVSLETSGGHMHTFSHATYPLVPQLHAPFTFSPPCAPPKFSPTNCFHPGYRPNFISKTQDFVPGQMLQSFSHPTNLVHHIDLQARTQQIVENEKFDAICQRLARIGDDAKELRQNPAKLQSTAVELEAMLKKINALLGLQTSKGESSQLPALYAKLDESCRNEENLKRQLVEYRDAHACKKQALANLEKEHEELQQFFDETQQFIKKMQGFKPKTHPRSCSVEKDFINNPNDVKNIEQKKSEVVGVPTNINTYEASAIMSSNSDVTVNSTQATSLPSYDPPPQHSLIESRNCPVYVTTAVAVPTQEVNSLKRSSSPLDLRVTSFAKVKKLHQKEHDTFYPELGKHFPSVSPYHSVKYYSSPSPELISSDEKRHASSPRSASSDSSDQTTGITPRNSTFPSGLLTSAQCTPGIIYSRHQGPIRVT